MIKQDEDYASSSIASLCGRFDSGESIHEAAWKKSFLWVIQLNTAPCILFL